MSRRSWSPPDPLALVLGSMVLASALVSVEMAGWVDDLPRLTLNGLGALLLATLLAALGVRWYLAHLSAFLVAVLAAIWQLMPVLAGKGWLERLVDLAVRMNAWGYAARTGGISTDYLPFYLVLLGFAWVGGYGLGWSTSRGRRAWWSIALCGVALLMNLNYGPSRLGIFFLVYILASLLLVVRLNQSQDPMVGRMAGGGRLFAISAALAVSLSLGAWFVPTPRESTDLLNVWYRVNAPWQDGLGQLNRLFAFLVSKERPGPGDFDKTLVIRGTSNLSDQPVMEVESSVPRYWRGLSYDYYTGQGWVVQDASQLHISGPEEPLQDVVSHYRATRDITQTVTILSPKNGLVFGAGAPKKVIDLDVTPETTQPKPVTLSANELAQADSLPAELRPFAGVLRDSLRAINPRADDGTIVTNMNYRLPAGVRVTGLVKGGNGRILGIQAVNRLPADITAWYASSPLQIGQKYTVVSSVSEATPDMLRSAGVGYPSWVTDRYLQLPSILPQRVRDLSQSLTADAKSSYDKALAVESYLRTFTYSTSLPSLPDNVDRVDHLLFTLKRGYSAYFSTAMVVMLRSIGVPAREVTGYAIGTMDPKAGSYLVKESNAHGWVEAFFPDYGWIEFEPTPSLPLMARGDTPVAESSVDDSLPDQVNDDWQSSPEEAAPEDSYSGALASEDWWPFASASLALPVLLAIVWMAWRRHWEAMDPAVAVYGKMALVGSWARLGPGSSQTPREYAETLLAALPRQTEPIKVILGNYERVRYGGRRSTSEESSELLRFWRRVRSELLRSFWQLGRIKRDH
ncbi:MAG: transglutaminaseTgpA domain-containing protein [Dehalococcoidia bacterium]|nr:transglutaminaseTgpA domain-containing protein [Dehalococcoidia bacterium]